MEINLYEFLQKKSNKMECENYRGISVTSDVGRLANTKKIVGEHIEESEEQNRFRPGRSCIDNIFCLRQLAEEQH